MLKQVAGVLGTSPGNNYGPPLDEEPIPFAEPDNSYNGPPLPPPYSTIGLPPFVEDHPPSYAMVEAIPDPRPSYGSPHGGGGGGIQAALLPGQLRKSSRRDQKRPGGFLPDFKVQSF